MADLIDRAALLAAGDATKMNVAFEDWNRLDWKTQQHILNFSRAFKRLVESAPAVVPDTNVGKWIPVSEAKPELIPNSAGTAYSDAVNCLTSGRKVITAIWDGTDFIGDAEFWEAEDEIITHWTPVLLPLPEEVEK